MFRAFRKLGQPTFTRMISTEAKEVKELIKPNKHEKMCEHLGGLTMLGLLTISYIEQYEKKCRYAKPSIINHVGPVLFLGPPLYFLGRGMGKAIGQNINKNIGVSLIIMAIGIGAINYNG